MLAIEATDLGDSPTLPRVQPVLRCAFNRLYSGSFGGRVVLPKLAGDVSFAFASNGADRLEACEHYRFRIGKFPGSLTLEEAALSALLGEARAGLLPAELRYILLADALHPLVSLIEKTLQMPIEWLPLESVEAAKGGWCAERAAFFSVTVPGESIVWWGTLQLDDDAALDALIPGISVPFRVSSVPANAFDRLRVPLRFRIGSTRLSLREVREIASGDIVSIEDWGSVGSAVRVSALVGGANGRLLSGLAEGSRITLQPTKEETMNRNTQESPLSDTTNLPLDRLDALEVTLQFNLGDLSVSLGELKALRPGHVFDLGQPLNRSTVRILAHGNVLGKGHLVAVGDRLGLRVSEFAVNAL